MNREEAMAHLAELEMSTIGSAAPLGDADTDQWMMSRHELSRLLDKWHLQGVDVLGREHYVALLRRERARSDRSGAPLSMTVCELDGDDPAGMQGLVELLRANKRETDHIGYLDDRILGVLLPETDPHGAAAFARRLQGGMAGIRVTSHAYPDEIFGRLLGREIGKGAMHPLLLPAAQAARMPGYPLKRALDVVGAGLLLLVLSPLMLFTALAVWLSSRGPVIFKQIRLGAGGVPFVFYKFRSMVCNADDSIHRRYVTGLIEGDHARSNFGDAARPLYKLQRDPRITPVGRIIRRASIDELPQLFNVLKGDMSLVGPRPPIPYEVERYQAWHLRRVLEIRPGITGLWQVQGRSRTSFDDMVRLDLRYVRECSLALDLRLLLRTAYVVLHGDGAK